MFGSEILCWEKYFVKFEPEIKNSTQIKIPSKQTSPKNTSTNIK